jgi:prepilin-type processing-associated H-X9-DG protein
MIVSERIEDCFSTSLVPTGLHYYTTWADAWTASWFAGANVGAVGAIKAPDVAGNYPSPLSPSATLPTAASATGYLRTTPTAFVGGGWLWTVQTDATPNNCIRANFSAAHPGSVQCLFGDGSVHSMPSGYSPSSMYFLSTPASGDIWPEDF